MKMKSLLKLAIVNSVLLTSCYHQQEQVQKVYQPDQTDIQIRETLKKMSERIERLSDDTDTGILAKIEKKDNKEGEAVNINKSGEELKGNIASSSGKPAENTENKPFVDRSLPRGLKVIKSDTGIKMLSDKNFNNVKKVLREGDIVEVVDIEGLWVKVKDMKGEEGYIYAVNPNIFDTVGQDIFYKENLYSVKAKEIPLFTLLNNVFSKEYSISLLSEVDSSVPVSVSFSQLPVNEACNTITSTVGYVCEVDRNNRKIVVKAYQEGVFSLPDGIEDLAYSLSVGGSLSGSQSGGGGGGQGGARAPSSQTNISSVDKVEVEGDIKRKAFEDFVKSLISEKGVISVDWSSKTLYVRDSREKVEAIKRYIEDSKKALNQSVYIEAKLFLVQTDNSLETGINWEAIGRNLGATLSGGLTDNVFSFRYAGNYITAIVQAVHRFGDVKDIISPRVRTTNLVPTQIIRGTNMPYVVFNPITTTGAGGTTTQSNASVGYAFDGVSLTVKPYIVDNEIYLTIKPLISSVDEYLTFTDNLGNRIRLPKVSMTTQITKIKMQDNETVMIGGLIWDGKKSTITGIPILDQIPILGRLFKQDLDLNKKIYLILAVYSKKD